MIERLTAIDILKTGKLNFNEMLEICANSGDFRVWEAFFQTQDFQEFLNSQHEEKIVNILVKAGNSSKVINYLKERIDIFGLDHSSFWKIVEKIEKMDLRAEVLRHIIQSGQGNLSLQISYVVRAVKYMEYAWSVFIETIDLGTLENDQLFHIAKEADEYVVWEAVAKHVHWDSLGKSEILLLAHTVDNDNTWYKARDVLQNLP